MAVLLKIWPLAAFVLVQVIDGYLTYLGVNLYGLSAEGNSVVALVMWGWGPAAGLFVLKAVGCILGLWLYLEGLRGALVGISVVYLVMVIVPSYFSLYIA